MTDSYSVAETKDGLTKILRRVEHGGHVFITRRGKPVAVLMSVKQFGEPAGGRPTFMEALSEFQRSKHAEHAVFDDAFFDGLRDQSPGREVTAFAEVEGVVMIVGKVKQCAIVDPVKPEEDSEE